MAIVNCKITAKMRVLAQEIADRATALTDGEFKFTQNITSKCVINLTTANYFAYQDEGVDGVVRNQGSKFKFTKMPPASAFSRYTGDKREQYAIAKSVQMKGLEPNHYFEKFWDDDTFMNKIFEFYLEFGVESILDGLEKLKAIPRRANRKFTITITYY